MRYFLFFLVVTVACGEAVKEPAAPQKKEMSPDTIAPVGPATDTIVQITDTVADKFDNGVRIEYLKKGDGVAIKSGDVVKFDYKLMNLRGEVLDGSHKLGFPIAIKQGVGIVPRGLDFALEQLRVNDKVKVEIPPQLGFGEDLNTNLVRPGEPIFYELSIVDVPVTKTISGVKLTVFHTEGGAQIRNGDRIGIDFFGYLPDGKLFDTSRKNDGDFEFTVGSDDIFGSLDMAIAQMKVGDKAYIEIPSAKGYGSKGLLNIVPANSDLIYMVTVDYKK